MASGLAYAAGLGKITVLSALGQPLRAEVEVNAARDEVAGMVARLAPMESFRQAGVEFSPHLKDLRFSLEKQPNGSSVLRVTSSRPVNEPFLDFLVELNWPTGRLVREYTFLLDPPEVAAKSAGKAVSVAEAKPVAGVKGGQEMESVPAAPKPVPQEVPLRPQPAPAAKPRAAESPAQKAAAETHLVRKGETLRQIATETQHEGVSLEQMLVGLYRANSDAFIGGNLNRMRAGVILNVPEKETVAAIPEAEAQKVYRAQAADWNAYRRKLAAAAADGPAKDDAGSQSAGGRITAKVDEKTSPADAQKDQVKVSRTEAGKAGAKDKAAEETLIAKDKALKEAQDRLALLEKNVGELQKLVEMKNQSLAELQKQAAARKADEPKAAAKPAEPAPAPAPVAEAPKSVEAPKPVEPPKAAEPVKPAETPQAPAPEAAKPVEPPKPVEAPKAAEEPKPAKKPVVVSEPEPEPEPGLVDELLENPLPLVGGAGLLALLAGLFVVKRRRSQLPAAPTIAAPDSASLGPNSVFRATGGQSVDTGNTTPQTTDFSQTGPGTIDTDEVDPVAEADVYMAYGRDAQAEEILLEALQKDPQRLAIHVKLLEIYAGRKSLKQFETLASELYAQTGGVGAEWEKVAAMGARLDPGNPLYSGSRTVPGGMPAFDADATMIVSPAEAARVNQAMAAQAPLEEVPLAPAPEPLPDLDVMTEETGETAPLAFEAPAAEPEPEAELMSLDFDLGSPEPVASPVPAAELAVEEEPVAAEPEEVGALDFDLGSPSFEPVPAEPAPSLPTPEPAEHASLDFDLDLGLPAAAEPAPSFDLDIPAEPEAVPDALLATYVGGETPEQAAPQPEPEVADGNLIDFQFDLGAPPAPEISLDPEATALVPAAEDEMLDIGAVDGDALEFDVSLTDSTVLGQPPAAPSFDIGSISLDLGEEGMDEVHMEPATPDAAMDPRWEEVNTKLDLAKAYEEMGDLEGARELLQEVMGEGSDDLVKQAKDILERLDA